MAQLTVLCVDDEEFILKAFKRLLRKEDFRILTARGGEEGLDILAREEVHIVASDQKMPGMSGSQFLARVRRKYPDAIRFTVSGYVDSDSIRSSILEGGIDRFLTKPWNKEQLVTSFGQCVEQFRIMERGRDLAAQSGMTAQTIQQLEQLRVQIIADLISAEPFDISSIQRLPLPTITTDSSGTVLSIHEAVGRHWKNLAQLRAGDRLLNTDVNSIADPLRDAIESGIQQKAINGFINDESVLVHAAPLITENGCEGCVVLIEHSVASTSNSKSHNQKCVPSV